MLVFFHRTIWRYISEDNSNGRKNLKSNKNALQESVCSHRIVKCNIGSFLCLYWYQMCINLYYLIHWLIQEYVWHEPCLSELFTNRKAHDTESKLCCNCIHLLDLDKAMPYHKLQRTAYRFVKQTTRPIALATNQLSTPNAQRSVPGLFSYIIPELSLMS
jgi:hypothetical protein